MTPDPAQWAARRANGESYNKIGLSEGVNPKTVARMIRKHQLGLEQRDLRRKAEGPTRAELRAANRPAPKSSLAKRQAVDPDALARFDKASAARTCLWIDGDLRDGKTAVCGMRRHGRNYCTEHQARVYDQRARKPVNPP